MGEHHDHAKRLLRQKMQADRRSLSAREAAERSVAVCGRILALRAFTEARQLVIYVAADNEVDPGPVATAAAQAGKGVYYPAAEDGEFRSFLPSSGGGAPLLPGEPLPRDATAVLFLVPGLAFDPRGVRLGRGGGWYDRALARHPGGTRIGLAYEFQVVPHLPEATWDVRVDAVVTERRILGPGVERIGQFKETAT